MTFIAICVIKSRLLVFNEWATVPIRSHADHSEITRMIQYICIREYRRPEI